MLKLAGKYADLISRNPAASAVAGGLGAAGLATAGNLISGEASSEGPGRLGLEALGAGALGAAFGSRIPALRGQAAQALRNLDAVSYSYPAAQARRAKMSPQEIQQTEFIRDALRATVDPSGSNAGEVRQSFKKGLRTGQSLINDVGIPVGLVGAGAMGGMVGGGLANIGNAVGIPGLQQQMAMDPESYGSSNTMLARSSVPTLRY
jgi:hypothetical protein